MARADEPPSRVEQRAFTKAGRLHLRLGPAYFGREDFYQSPGIGAEIGYNLLETLAVDLSATLLFSTLNSEAAAVRTRTGRLPEAEQPNLRIGLGPRWSFAYGKLLVEPTGTVLHFDLALLFRLGALVTDRGVNFGGDLGLGLQMGLDSRLLVWAEVAGWLSYEAQVHGGVAAGPLLSGGIGVRL